MKRHHLWLAAATVALIVAGPYVGGAPLDGGDHAHPHDPPRS